MIKAVVTPVFNDYKSFAVLYERLCLLNIGLTDVFVVDDGSTEIPDPETLSGKIPITIIKLVRNVGHQRAISIGLSYVYKNYNQVEYVVVMDSDGEDAPEDLPRLISQVKDKIVFAKRRKRTESFLFRFFYILYKIVFKMLTGKIITFGNFSVISGELLKKIVYVSEIANHYSSGVIHAKIPIQTSPVDRGKRFIGKSKMNFSLLIFHGISAITVHIEIVAVRLLIACMVFILLSVIGIIAVIIVKFYSSLAIPGWATYVSLSLLNILFQTLFIIVLLVFISSIYKNFKKFIPVLDFEFYIDKINKLN